MEWNTMKCAAEAMLFAHGDALSTDKIAEVLQSTAEEIESLLYELQEEYASPSRGICLMKLDDKWQFTNKNEYAPQVKSVLEIKRSSPLSPAALEVLAIIAYNQPVSRAFIEQVRGVDSSSSVSGLLEKGLIEEAGRLDLPGRPVSFKTTDAFLRCFEMESLAELPPLHEEELPLEYIAKNGEMPSEQMSEFGETLL